MFKRTKHNNIFMCVAEILIGILLLINPVGFTRGIIVALGAVLTVQGVRAIVGYFRADPQTASGQNLLARGLLMACLGLFCMFRSSWFIAAFPVLTMFYGALILASAFEKVQWTVDMIRRKQRYWFVALIGALLSIAASVLILANPFASTAALWIFVGVSLIVEAVVDAITLLFERK